MAHQLKDTSPKTTNGYGHDRLSFCGERLRYTLSSENSSCLKVCGFMRADEFRNLARQVPLLGGLVDCDGADHWEALGANCFFPPRPSGWRRSLFMQRAT